MQKQTSTNIGLSGYGVFGSQFLDYLKQHAPDIRVKYVIEPNRHKRDLLKKLEYITHESVYDTPHSLLKLTDVIVDCSTRGQGILNKRSYQELGLNAIFQNGEESEGIGSLFYPGVTETEKPPQYTLIPLCSGIAAIKILHAIIASEIAIPVHVTGYHGKVTNTARMLTMNYGSSNKQIEQLLGVNARMNVIYLRGEPYNGIFAYHGNMLINLDRSVTPKQIISILKNAPLIKVKSQEIDHLTSPSKTTDTLVIKESVYVRQNLLQLATISYTPDVNFPINLAAIRTYTNH